MKKISKDKFYQRISDILYLTALFFSLLAHIVCDSRIYIVAYALSFIALGCSINSLRLYRKNRSKIEFETKANVVLGILCVLLCLYKISTNL